jgi:ATP-dependent Clp protease protease subunit
VKNKYYALETNGKEVDIYIFGDITSWEWYENDVSSYTLSKELQALDPDIETINVHINSYGGEVAEGLAIHNLLRNHKAKVRTYCDGFACSSASVVFMAGDERIMNTASLLFIHNAWMYTAGNASQLRKQADDLDTITQASINAYMQHVNITEDKLKELLDEETWLLPSEALEMGFATSIVGEKATEKAAASARKALFNLLAKKEAETISIDAIVDKLFERVAADFKQLNDKTINDADGKEPTSMLGGKVVDKEPPYDEPLANKTKKFFNALIGRKEG